MVIVKRTDGPPISPGPSALPLTASIFVTFAVSALTITVGFEMVAVLVGCGVAAATGAGVGFFVGFAVAFVVGAALGVVDGSADATAVVLGPAACGWLVTAGRGEVAAETTPITTNTTITAASTAM